MTNAPMMAEPQAERTPSFERVFSLLDEVLARSMDLRESSEAVRRELVGFKSAQSDEGPSEKLQAEHSLDNALLLRLDKVLKRLNQTGEHLHAIRRELPRKGTD